MYQFTAPFRGARRVPSPDQSPTSTPCVKGAFGVLRIPLRSTLDPLRSGLRLAPTRGHAGVGHDTPVSDQVSDNGTEHSGISVPGRGRLATGKIIKRRPSEVLRDEEVDGPVSVVVSFPCVLHCSRPGISPWRAA